LFLFADGDENCDPHFDDARLNPGEAARSNSPHDPSGHDHFQDHADRGQTFGGVFSASTIHSSLSILQRIYRVIKKKLMVSQLN